MTPDRAASTPATPARSAGGNRCPVRYCTGQLRGETDEIGRMYFVCDDCERRAKLEHDAKFGTYLEHLRAQRREREARQLEARLQEEAERGPVPRCVVCADPLTPPRTRVCEKVECRRTYKAEYQRRLFGRPSRADAPTDTTPEPSPLLDLFKDFP